MKGTEEYRLRDSEHTRLRRQNESIELRRRRLDQDRLRKQRLRENESRDNCNIQCAKRKVQQRGRKHAVYDNGDFNFYDNFDRKTAMCNPYYKHHEFVNSHNDNDWEKAKQSEMFGFQRMQGHQSLELYWNKKCPECGAMYLDGESPAFMTKCCGSFKAHGMECIPSGLKDLPPLLTSIKKAIKDMTNYSFHLP